MRNIILILLGFLFVLSGCSNTSYTEEDLVAAGYIKDETTNEMYMSWNETRVFVSFDESGSAEAIGIDDAPTSFQSFELIYVFAEEVWSATYDNGKEIIDVNPADLYAYLDNNPEIDATSELEKLADSKNISTRDLKDGDVDVIASMIAPDFAISNVKVVDSTYTDPDVEDNYLYTVSYVQVNFDLTNNTSEDIDLDEMDFKVCYDSKAGYGCSELEVLEQEDTITKDQTLQSGETLSVQRTAVVPTDATNFTISFALTNKSISATYPSEVINKSN